MEIEHSFNEENNATEFKLPASLPGEEAKIVADELLAVRNKDLLIVADEVERADTPCIEVLLAAAKLWSEDGCSMSFSSISDQLKNAISVLGFAQSDFEVETN